MGLRSNDVVTALAVLLFSMPSFAFAQAAPDCGPQFNRLTADNAIPSYRQALAKRETLTAFHHSIPVVYSPLDLPSEAEVALVRACYRRIEGLLTPRAVAGDLEAQFVLGDLLLRAHSPLGGGHMAFGPPEVEVRQRGHNWLLAAVESGHFDAVEALVWFYGLQLGFSVLPDPGGKYSTAYPWLPAPEAMLDWLEWAGARGHRIAYLNISSYYVKRFTYTLLESPEEAQGYLALSSYYRRLSAQSLPPRRPDGDDRGR